ncbi:DMT family transporter [Rhodanobacter denitrificans]|uniref:Putative permease, DMT superfamily n=1 Tax=Rhodanobacter denitrificans TaxID=666685 RepID=M4NKM0_9GAMM|nr:DMT family transporter [Rhodanobacter denitrificans]AGG90632.1 putative permease, DMT superfamily [Rhodanobacter denitrificans]UJM86014.1 DMT family transporter [Rhodanobacter denitrificans]
MDTAERLDGRALVAIAIALLTWSSAYAAIAYALPAFTPGEVAFARLLIGSLCFAVLLRVKRVPLPTRRDWPLLALLGVLGLTVYHLCLNYAETRIASGTAAILISLVPAATAAVSALWLRERLALRSWVGLAVALLGTVLVVLASGQRVEVDPKALLVLVCVMVSAIFFVGQKALFARNSMLGVTAFAFFAGTLAALPFGWHLPQALLTASWAHIGALLWLGIAPTFVGYLAWNMAVNRASASRVSSFIYLSPPIALLIGWLWLHEVPNALILVGGAITVGGVVLANARRRAAPVSAAPVEACEQC